MNRKSLYASVLLVIVFLSFSIYGRQWRVDQIPNGQKFSCANCHIDPFGGGPRNKFGQAVEALVSPGGTQEFWGQSLAKLDSDGDGVSNGEELGDPSGAWRAGQQNPGELSQVANPGDINSRPPMADVNSTALVNTYKLYQNYPNPFNPTTVIGYQLPLAGLVTLKIYDVIGREIATLVNNYQQAGSYNIQLSTDHLPAGRQGYQLASGIYFYKLTAGSYSSTRKMILLR